MKAVPSPIPSCLGRRHAPEQCGTGGDAYWPRVAVDGSGNAFALWEQPDGIRTIVWARRFDASGDRLFRGRPCTGLYSSRTRLRMTLGTFFSMNRRGISVPFPACAMMLVSLLLLFPAIASSAPVAKVSEGIESLRKLLESPSGGAVVVFTHRNLMKDLFFPSFKEGKIRSLELVVPDEESLTVQNLGAWNTFISSLAPGTDNAFVLKDGAFEGQVDGFPVRVVSLKEWKGPPEKGPVILDLTFLLAMHRDDVRKPFVEIPPKFFSLLADRKVDTARVRFWVPGRDDVPLFYGYLYKLASEAARDPKAFRKGLPPKWRDLARGEYLNFVADYEQALASFNGYLKLEPEEPSVLFKIARMNFVEGRVERGLRFLGRACKADRYYIRGYSTSAFALFQTGELDAAERVIRAGLHLEPNFSDLKVGLGQVLLAQAKGILPKNAPAAEKRFSEIVSIGLPEEALQGLRSEWERAKSNLAPSFPGH